MSWFDIFCLWLGRIMCVTMSSISVSVLMLMFLDFLYVRFVAGSSLVKAVQDAERLITQQDTEGENSK